ncbi:MAG: hypothetical protein IT308_00040 [Anaerolineaceae bacterium]|nr:hypothetical protein [Anaerolineaceae bacterium]
MSEILQSMLVILATGILITLIFLFLSYRKRQKDTQMEQVARERGWTLERIRQPLISGYLLHGKTAQGTWSLETLAEASSTEASPGSSEVSHKTRWWSTDISLPGRAVIIGPLPAGSNTQVIPSFSAPLFQMVLKKMLGEDAGWVSGLSQVGLKCPVLEKQFLCLANDEGDVNRLINFEVENVLLSLPDKIKPVIKFRSAGLEISLPGVQLASPAELEAVIRLGRSLTAAWQA